MGLDKMGVGKMGSRRNENKPTAIHVDWEQFTCI